PSTPASSAEGAPSPRASCARATGPEASPDRTAIACTARGELELVRRRLEPLARPMSAHDHGGAACGELEHALEQGAAGQAVGAGKGLIEQQQPGSPHQSARSEERRVGKERRAGGGADE